MSHFRSPYKRLPGSPGILPAPGPASRRPARNTRFFPQPRIAPAISATSPLEFPNSARHCVRLAERRMGAGVVDRARLESVCAPKGHRGFESLPIRWLNFAQHLDTFSIFERQTTSTEHQFGETKASEKEGPPFSWTPFYETDSQCNPRLRRIISKIRASADWLLPSFPFDARKCSGI